MVFCLGHAFTVSSVTLILAAFIGACLSMGFVLLISNRIGNMSSLIIGGVMIGYICTAVTDFVVTFADDADIVNLHNWSKGSFSGMTWNNVTVMSVLVFVITVIIFCLATNRGISVGRILCTEYGGQHQTVPGNPGHAFQPACSLYHRICGTGIFCRNRSTTSGQKSVWNS